MDWILSESGRRQREARAAAHPADFAMLEF